MKKCLYCYQSLNDVEIDFHPKCVKLFFGMNRAPVLPFKQNELEKLAQLSVKESITVPGVQPKLSLGWIKDKMGKGAEWRLTILDALDGNFILKPQHSDFTQIPENEHLSMKLAQLFKLDTVPVSLIRMDSGELACITKRVDRNTNNSKNHMIDFLQILELSDKYLGTTEMLGNRIGELSMNVLQDKLRFFEVTLFNYIIGNNDMHLKNYSMLKTSSGWVLSPFYDLINVKLILPKDKEDSALLLGGKKQNFNKGYFDRLAQYLSITNKQMESVYKRINTWLPEAKLLIEASFLSDKLKMEYVELIESRCKLF